MDLTILFILIAVLTFPRKDDSVELRILFLIFFGFISIVLSYRASDFPIYKFFYEQIEPLHEVVMGNNDYFVHEPYNFELGYKVLNSFFKMFGPYIEFLYIPCNLLILGVIFFFFKNKSLNFYKLFLPYYTFVFITIQVGIIRQVIAIAIFYLSVQFIVKRRFLPYFVGTVFSFLFHSSAIILPPLYFVAKRVYSARSLIIVYVIGLLLFVQIIPFSIMTVLEPLSNILLPNIGSKLTYYMWQMNQLEAPSKFNLGIFDNSLTFFIILRARYDLSKKGQWDEFMNVSLNFSMLYIFLYIYIFEFANAIYRVNYYFIFFKFFIIVKYIESFDSKAKRLITHLALIFYCAIMLVIRILQGH